MNNFKTPQEVFVVTGDLGQHDENVAVPYAHSYYEAAQPPLTPMDFPGEYTASQAEPQLSDTSVNLALLNTWNRLHPEDNDPESSVSKMRASLNMLADTAITAVGSDIRASASDLLSGDQINTLRETLAKEASGESDWDHPDVMSNIALAGLLLKQDVFQRTEASAPQDQRVTPTSHRKGGAKHAQRPTSGRHRA